MITSDIVAKLSSYRRTTAFITGLLVISVGMNAGLAYKLRQFLDAQEVQLAKIEARELKPGTEVAPLSLKRVGVNTVETINYLGLDRSTVIYVMSPMCGWCVRNEASIRELIASQGSSYRFIGILLAEEGAQEYAAAHSLGIPLYTGLSEVAKKAYKMGGTPQTIVVSPKGVVIANWNGAYLGKQKEAIEDFFKIKLPEIDLKKQAAH